MMESPPCFSTRRLLLRPLGYRTISVIWLVLFLMMALLWTVFFWTIHAPMGDEVGIQGTVGFFLIVPIVSPILGPAYVFLTGATLSLTALSVLALGRSLRPGYAREPLTTTTWSSSAIGTPVHQTSAISLIPLRPSRPATFWTATMFRSVLPSRRRILGAALIGAGYLITVGWIKWPSTGAWAVFWALVGAALILAGLRLLLGHPRTARPAADRADNAIRARPQPTARDLRRLAERRRRQR